ncbi:MAG: restriction endonuclease subunit S [Desulfuromonadaceae bacterium]
MTADFTSSQLSDFLSFKNGKSSPERNDEAPYPVFGSNGLIGYADKTNSDQNTIVIGRVGSYCGSVQFSDTQCWVSDNAIICTSKNPEESLFWYYFLKLSDLNQYRSGSGQPLLNQNTLNSITCKVPAALSERIQIGEVLASLDRKQNLNHQINQTLEQMAQAIFKSWFVDFEPVKAKIAALKAGGSEEDALHAAIQAISGKDEAQLTRLQTEHPEQYAELRATAELFPSAMQDSELGAIPEGWGVLGLGELCETITKGTTPKKTDIAEASDPANVPFIKVKDIADTGEIIQEGLNTIPDSVHRKTLKRSILKTDDLLFSIAGTIGRVAIVDTTLESSNTNQAVGIIRLREQEKYLSLVWQILLSDRTQNEIRSKVVQGVQANASLKNLRDIRVLLPYNYLVEIANSKLDALLRQILSNRTQSRNIIEIRDTILPKLLSGELSVTKAEDQIADIEEPANV